MKVLTSFNPITPPVEGEKEDLPLLLRASLRPKAMVMGAGSVRRSDGFRFQEVAILPLRHLLFLVADFSLSLDINLGVFCEVNSDGFCVGQANRDGSCQVL